MNWTDDDIDQLFRSADSQREFQYDAEYFAEIERQLPVARSRKSLLWWSLSCIMFVSFSTLFFMPTMDAPVHVELRSSLNYRSLNKHLPRKSRPFERSDVSASNENEISSKVASDKSALNVNSFVEVELLKIAGVDENQTMIQNKPLEEADSMNLYPKMLVGQYEFTPDPYPFANVNFKKVKRSSFYLELSGGIQQAWTKIDGNQRWNNSVSLASGMVWHRAAWSFDVGASFRWYDLNDLEIRERTKIYGFGYSTYNNSYAFTGMASLSLPMHVNYSFGRHELGAGLELGKNLFAGLRRVQSLDDEVFLLTQGVTDVSLLNKYAANIGLGYSYKLNDKVSLGTSVNYQLIHPLSSERFEGDAVSQPVSFNIHLRTQLGR